MIDFIVEDKPWSMRPQFKKLQGPLREPLVDSAYLNKKIIELAKVNTPLWFCTDEAKDILPHVAKKLNVNNGNILDIGFQLNEDIVVMHKGRMQASFFAFPSGWAPHEKKNMTLTEIHGPVADGDELRTASERISQMMCNGLGPWYRYVWTIASTNELSLHPQYLRHNPEYVEDLYFRYEYQTFDTVLVGETSVFLVKTTVIPYLQYIDTKEKHDIILKNLNSMSEDVLTYKNLHKAKSILNKFKF